MKVVYDRSLIPPAPLVPIRIAALGRAFRQPPEFAIIDTGADVTILPRRFLQELRIRSHRGARLRLFDSSSRQVELVLVDLEIAEMRLPGIEVVRSDTAPELILGRNVLNKLRIVLDGPRLEAEIYP